MYTVQAQSFPTREQKPEMGERVEFTDVFPSVEREVMHVLNPAVVNLAANVLIIFEYTTVGTLLCSFHHEF